MMPKVEVVGFGTYVVDEGTKLVLAMEDNGVDVLHRCGGNARCTTCRVEIIEGDPGVMTDGEIAVRESKGIQDPNIRLSCQIRVRSSLKVKPLMTKTSSGMDAGPRPVD